MMQCAQTMVCVMWSRENVHASMDSLEARVNEVREGAACSAHCAAVRLQFRVVSCTGRCPSSCSGHGNCQSMKEIANAYGSSGTNALASTGLLAYTNWDSSVLYSCVCDRGWVTADCSSRTLCCAVVMLSVLPLFCLPGSSCGRCS
jgi:hypothetical protein